MEKNRTKTIFDENIRPTIFRLGGGGQTFWNSTIPSAVERGGALSIEKDTREKVRTGGTNKRDWSELLEKTGATFHGRDEKVEKRGPDVYYAQGGNCRGKKNGA